MKREIKILTAVMVLSLVLGRIGILQNLMLNISMICLCVLSILLMITYTIYALHYSSFSLLEFIKDEVWK